MDNAQLFVYANKNLVDGLADSNWPQMPEDMAQLVALGIAWQAGFGPGDLIEIRNEKEEVVLTVAK